MEIALQECCWQRLQRRSTTHMNTSVLGRFAAVIATGAATKVREDPTVTVLTMKP